MATDTSLTGGFAEGITGTLAYLGEKADAISDFMSEKPIIGALLLSVLVCIVGWEATHPPKHPEKETDHGR